MDVDLEIETVRAVPQVGHVVRALGGAFHCWTDDAALADRASGLMDRPVRLTLDPERVEGQDSGPRLTAVTALPLPPAPDLSYLEPLDFVKRRGALRGRRA